MAAEKEVYKWTSDQTRALIKFRAENEEQFTKKKYASKQLYETLIKQLGLEGKVNVQQVGKKWENLKKKYKDLKTPRTGSGTESGEKTAANWPFYQDMHEVLGGRPCIEPPVLVASLCNDATTLLMSIVEPREDSASSPGLPTTPTAPDPTTPPPRKKPKTNPILEFLKQESAKEQKRHEETEAKTERFLSLFEKLVNNKMPEQ